MKLTKIINFYGGPGAGKSTMALKLTSWMKHERMNVEYTPEVAKELTWKGHYETLDDQVYVFSMQHHALYSLLNKVDYIISDSPILLSLYYGVNANKLFPHIRPRWNEAFSDLIWETYNFYDNINFVVERNNRKYVDAGRNQTEEEAKTIDAELIQILSWNKLPFERVSKLDDVLHSLGLIEVN